MGRPQKMTPCAVLCGSADGADRTYQCCMTHNTPFMAVHIVLSSVTIEVVHAAKIPLLLQNCVSSGHS